MYSIGAALAVWPQRLTGRANRVARRRSMTILRAVLSGSVLSTAIIFEVVNRPVGEEEGVQSCFERPRSLHPRAIEADATGSRTMDANELRTLQAPLKKQYREQPETGRT